MTTTAPNRNPQLPDGPSFADDPDMTGGLCTENPKTWHQLPQASQRAICHECPLQATCLTLGVQVYRDTINPRMLTEVFGGATPSELRHLARTGRPHRTQQEAA